MVEKRKIFALDIGTRSVVGIILEQSGNDYHVADLVVKEHRERAMLDGQIHDIVAVAETISKIKLMLEETHGKLEKVCVAAAGRALKTEKACESIKLSNRKMITKEDILQLELSAVQKAQATAAQKNAAQKIHYYCVGYSVLFYRLNGEEIGNLIDQQGEEASVSIIATFLPKMVVDSLIAALHRADLEMEALTLEPIAAINVLIPPSMRRLNVALVDIGAGTSDIAITNTGTVTAYGMVSTAGDEITEAISDHYLMDFPLADQTKRNLIHQEMIVIQDILGLETEIPRAEIIKQILPAIETLASTIAKEIFKLNNEEPPKAVMLVGGGSLTPALPKKLATLLQLPENRVAIRGTEAIQNLTMATTIQQGPEFVTPIGIAIASQKAPVQYVTVSVNDIPIRLFEINRLTVGDCLLAAGIKIAQLHGKPGMALFITFNGRDLTIPGEHGSAPFLQKNGLTCSLDDLVANGDQISVVKGKDGKQATVKISELIDEPLQKTVYLNGIQQEIKTILKRNGLIVDMETLVQDRDTIEVFFPKTLEELLIHLDGNDVLQQLTPFQVTINGKETFFPAFSHALTVNGKVKKRKDHFHHLDYIELVKAPPLTVAKLAELKQLKLRETMTIYFHDQEIMLEKDITYFYRRDELLAPNDIVHKYDDISIKAVEAAPFIFQDIFNYVEIEMPPDAQGQFELLKNGEKSTFYDPLVTGDRLEIIWPLASHTKWKMKTE
ncbi:pilus assembly protein PilM [Bacillus chungangensis]|uniref:Cell division protein FtsA n=1 Tax=Bacillus chungangensis TaxID=587633 RepID=A0ABT9WU84_9BACI|nr:pilus assembly protein PilM [Bacillus chungangensis]MDQ0176858.1 cell division protein FtsA [Bacillus chungangensis]